jgi:hypothetical protein
MFCVAYRSTLDSGVGEAEVQSIASLAAQKNAEVGVTGLWLLSGHQNLSAIEGAPREVRHLIETIWDDPRHGAFKLLSVGAIPYARFDWPFRLIRAQSLEEEPALREHPGINWLCGFSGGVDAFFGTRQARSATGSNH